MSLKILISGIGSRVGTRGKEAALSHGHEVMGLSRKELDIRDLSACLKIIEDVRPDIVVHTAAITDVDFCEKEKKDAWDTNVSGSENIALASFSSGARLIFISTDYVFDGRNGPYNENEIPHPINYYGKTKLEAENRVLAVCKDALILRISVPYDWNPGAKPNFLNWLVSKLELKKPFTVVNDQWNTPTYVPHLAEIIIHLCSTDAQGIFNVAGGTYLNRYDFAVKTAEIFGYDTQMVSPCSSDNIKQIAPRPMKAGLYAEKAEKILGVKMLSVEEGLRGALPYFQPRQG